MRCKAAKMEDLDRERVEWPVGADGEFFVAGNGFAGQDHDPSVLDYNNPPKTQPGLWCQWTPNQEGTAIEWDGGEKFYDYEEWLEYLITNFLAPWGYFVNGEVTWQGEESSDMGKIIVVGNKVSVRKGKVIYE